MFPAELWLEKYRTSVESEPEIQNSRFKELLNRARNGDENAQRRISGSMLRVALEVAERHSVQMSAIDLIAIVQEANAALQQAISSFTGDDLEAFIKYAREHIRQHLLTIS